MEKVSHSLWVPPSLQGLRSGRMRRQPAGAQRRPLLFVLVYIPVLVTAQTVLLSAAQRDEGNVNVPAVVEAC